MEGTYEGQAATQGAVWNGVGETASSTSVAGKYFSRVASEIGCALKEVGK